METLLNKLNSIFSYLIIPVDKQLHIWTGIAGGFLLSILIGAWAILAVAIVSAFKEFYDYHHPNIHTYDLWDFIASSIGGVFGYLLFYMVIG